MPGYTDKFVDKLKNIYFCPLCKLPMRDPVQLVNCGHRFCDSCLQDYLRDGPLECPEDKNYLDYAKIYPDVELGQEIQSRMIKCCHHIEGCLWTDQLYNFKTHMEVCRYRPETCPNQCSSSISRASLDEHIQYTCTRRNMTCENCGQNFQAELFNSHEGKCAHEKVWCENKCSARVQRRYLNNHMRNECHKRLADCHYCGKQFLYETLQTHQYSCPRYPVACPNRCEPCKIAREDMELHIMDHCPSTTINCAFKEFGCQHKCPRHSMDKHLDSACKPHLSMACRALLKQNQQITALRARLSSACHVTSGMYIWRLSEYKLRMADSKAKIGLETVSDSFYTHSYGYKMSVSAFLNGNGPGENSYLSVYLRLLPGDYDNLLGWPFVLPVTFTLLDQSDEKDKRQHIVESFVPDRTWKHFQKPGRDDTMLGFGYPKFISHELLKTRTYLKDDCIFIRVKIDVSKLEESP